MIVCRSVVYFRWKTIQREKDRHWKKWKDGWELISDMIIRVEASLSLQFMHRVLTIDNCCLLL